MSEQQDSAEPLQKLLAGMPRRYAEYKPVAAVASAGPPTNVGGYDELLDYFHGRGQTLPRSEEGLTAIDHLIDGAADKESWAWLASPIGVASENGKNRTLRASGSTYPPAQPK